MWWAALLWASTASAAEPLTYEDALAAAVNANPQLRQAQALADQAADDVIAASGVWDPNLSLSGGYNRGQRGDVRAEFQTLFITDSEGWNTALSLSGTAPTGTSASLDVGLVRTTTQTDFQVYGNPALDPSQFFSSESVGFYIPNLRMTLAQELLKGLRLKSNLSTVRQAKERQDQASLELERSRQQALADVARAYWSWVYLADLADISHQSVEVAEEAFRVGAAKVDAGESPPVEKTRLEAALVQAQAAAIDADQSAAQARDTLLLAMGRDPGQALDPASVPGKVPELDLDADQLVETALQEALDVRLARAQVDAARASVKDARHAVLPSLTANVSGGFNGAVPDGIDGDVGFFDLVLPSVDVGGTFSVPLGGRAARGARLRSESELVRQQETLAAAEAQVRANVQQQVRVLESAALQVRLADVNVRLARETLAADEALHAVGRAVLKDVLEARTELARAQGEAVKARTDFQVAVVELRRLLGRMDLGASSL